MVQLSLSRQTPSQQKYLRIMTVCPSNYQCLIGDAWQEHKYFLCNQAVDTYKTLSCGNICRKICAPHRVK